MDCLTAGMAQNLLVEIIGGLAFLLLLSIGGHAWHFANKHKREAEIAQHKARISIAFKCIRDAEEKYGGLAHNEERVNSAVEQYMQESGENDYEKALKAVQDAIALSVEDK